MKRLIKPAGWLFAVTAIAGVVSLFGASLAHADDKQLAAGKKVFERSMCINCHPGGDNTLQPSKPLKGEKFKKKFKDDQAIETVIRNGNPAAGMPSFPDRLINETEMKALIAYIRTFTPSSKPAK
jgi:mono/diheme cytochrome c family protein